MPEIASLLCSTVLLCKYHKLTVKRAIHWCSWKHIEEDFTSDLLHDSFQSRIFREWNLIVDHAIKRAKPESWLGTTSLFQMNPPNSVRRASQGVDCGSSDYDSNVELFISRTLKDLRHGWHILKKMANVKFAVRNPSNLLHPCSCLVYYHLYDVFLS